MYKPSISPSCHICSATLEMGPTVTGFCYKKANSGKLMKTYSSILELYCSGCVEMAIMDREYDRIHRCIGCSKVCPDPKYDIGALLMDERGVETRFFCCSAKCQAKVISSEDVKNVKKIFEPCVVCHKSLKTCGKCGRCGKVTYCGRKCQVSHWKVHKRNCVVKN